MSISLTEASKLSTDILLKGIIETMIKESPILERLPFIQITGNSLKYNREKTLPTVAWYDPVTDTWVTSEPAFEQCSSSLGILGGDADVDNFLKSTRSNVQDLETAVIEQKAKALRHEFENTFLNGDSGVNSKQPDGLHKTLKGTAWQASHAYSLGDVVVPTAGLENGFRYECTTAGTSGASEPTWSTVEGGTTTDGSVTWTTRFGGHLGSGASGATLSLDKQDRPPGRPGQRRQARHAPDEPPVPPEDRQPGQGPGHQPLDRRGQAGRDGGVLQRHTGGRLRLGQG